MSKIWIVVLVGLGMAGCSQQVGNDLRDGPSLGTLRHRGKSYAVREVVTAKGWGAWVDPFLREMTEGRPVLADGHSRERMGELYRKRKPVGR